MRCPSLSIMKNIAFCSFFVSFLRHVSRVGSWEKQHKMIMMMIIASTCASTWRFSLFFSLCLVQLYFGTSHAFQTQYFPTESNTPQGLARGVSNASFCCFHFLNHKLRTRVQVVVLFHSKNDKFRVSGLLILTTYNHSQKLYPL